MLDQRTPQGGVKCPVLMAGTEEPRVAALHFVAAVTGDAREGIIDVDDGAVSGGDHDAFPGMGEDAGGQLQFFFGQFVIGDVLVDPQQSKHAVVPIPERDL